MIHSTNISVQSPSPDPVLLARKAKARDNESAAPSSPAGAEPADTAQWSERVLSENFRPVLNQSVTAATSPIAEAGQAVDATHHASALIQAQPQLAMLAQANSSSQSVQRLLQ